MRSTTETALADVCFVLEGTYPFVAGGVSSWVHHLVTHLPELTFTILHISAKRGCYEKRAYDVPGNVLDVEELYLHEPFSLKGLLKRRAPREKVRTLSGFIRDLRDGETAHFPDLVKAMQSLRSSTRPDDLLLDRGNWNSLTEGFKSEAPEESFLNYFWNWYYAHQPLVNILAAPLPDAGMYHTVSTGYAGVLAAAASLRWNRPMILTEHGIYTKERRIEIYSAEWIKDREGDSVTIEREAPYFRRFWNRQFRMMSRITYEQAAEIFTLYTENTREQIQDGADPEKLRIIPNGIDIKRFEPVAKLLAERAPNERFTIGFIGRVCPIKDVRTFISAMCLVAAKVPDVLVRILGPMEEDPEYAEECKRFTRALNLEENLRFEGRVAIDKELPTLDLVILTSISEAQPLVVLEAGAAGLPVITTDVGCCDELLNGRTPEDRALGPGGLITPIASPGETAKAVMQLYEDEGLRKKMGKNLMERVKAYYDQGDMVGSYRDVYRTQLERTVV